MYSFGIGVKLRITKQNLEPSSLFCLMKSEPRRHHFRGIARGAFVSIMGTRGHVTDSIGSKG